ncbi:MAG TPA: hypothetical protein GX497_15915 [Bacillus bacterium]|nr:hypothetical protein [Bacillus sp. (in: firmicutes)]
MGVSSLSTGNTLRMEDQKLATQQRLMTETNNNSTAQDTQTSKNQSQELEGLFSGKTEQELYAQENSFVNDRAQSAQNQAGAANGKINYTVEDIFFNFINIRNQSGNSSEINNKNLLGSSDQKNSENSSGAKAVDNPVKEKKLEKPEVKRQIRELQNAEQNVRMHEQAHKAAGAGVTGAISYSYSTGPDGKKYITGGEVSVQAPEGNTPEESIQILEKVKSAALAPADPSSQDLSVAANATAQIQQKKAEMSSENTSLQDDAEAQNEPLNGSTQKRSSKENDNNKSEITTFVSDQTLDTIMFEKTYKKAVTSYTEQMKIAKNNFSVEQPLFLKVV